MRKEIVIGGSGGQGVQSFGNVLAKTLDNKGDLVSLSFNYGPEARGGRSYANIIIKATPDDWPELLQIDILVVLSQPSYDACLDKIHPNSIIVYDKDMVKPAQLACKQYGVPAVETATSLGSTIMTNMVMLGAMASITGICTLDDFVAYFGKNAATDKRMEFLKKGYTLVPNKADALKI